MDNSKLFTKVMIFNCIVNKTLTPMRLPLLRPVFKLFPFKVPERGLEPPCLAAYAPEAYVATNYTTPAMVNSVAGLRKKGRGKLNLSRSRNQNKNTIIYDSIFSNIVVTSC